MSVREIVRQVSVGELSVSAQLFVPQAFAAYTVGADGVCRSLMGPSIQGHEWRVTAVDGLSVSAVRLSDGLSVTQAAPSSEQRVTVLEGGR